MTGCAGCHDPRVFGHQWPCPGAGAARAPRTPDTPNAVWLWSLDV